MSETSTGVPGGDVSGRDAAWWRGYRAAALADWPWVVLLLQVVATVFAITCTFITQDRATRAEKALAETRCVTHRIESSSGQLLICGLDRRQP